MLDVHHRTVERAKEKLVDSGKLGKFPNLPEEGGNLQGGELDESSNPPKKCRALNTFWPADEMLTMAVSPKFLKNTKVTYK